MEYAFKKQEAKSYIHLKDYDYQATQKWHDAEEFKWRVRYWANKMGVEVSQVHFRIMSTKWASISTRGRLSVNIEMLQIPKIYGEYVIVHELVHLLAPNHGKVFKSFMDAYYPGWIEIEKNLQGYSIVLST
jgi:predicted metal-dependent hydrolase